MQNATVTPYRLIQEYTHIQNSLKFRGYPNNVLKRAKNIVDLKAHDKLLSTVKTNVATESRLTLVLEYNNQFSVIKNVVSKYIPILSKDETMEEILKDGYRVVTRKSQSLGNILSPSLFLSYMVNS